GIFSGQGFDQRLLFLQEDSLLLVLLAQLGTDSFEKIDRHCRVLLDQGIKTLSRHSQECRCLYRRDAGRARLVLEQRHFAKKFSWPHLPYHPPLATLECSTDLHLTIHDNVQRIAWRKLLEEDMACRPDFFRERCHDQGDGRIIEIRE